MTWRLLVSLLLIFLLQSCLTYYDRNRMFNEEFARGDYGKADHLIEKNKFLLRPRNKLLYLLEKGVVSQLRGNFEESNKLFEEAYIFVEDFERNYGQEALALLTNDMMRKYGGEDFEKVYINYYKAINFIRLDDLESAMVECRRVNIRLDEITDKYKSEKKFKRDAFAHTLMGILYEATGDENNAFIAYRNAYEIYSKDYKEFFNMEIPKQLKKDLLRTASQNGFYEELERYEKEFSMKFDRKKTRPKKELIAFWHNGFGPVKQEWSINFFLIRGQGGAVTFVNEQYGMNFTFYARSNDDYATLSDVKVVRVAFPKYSERKHGLTGAKLTYGQVDHQLELLEDINKIAVKSLNDRMFREMSKALLRLALKQAAEAAARKENENLGAALSVFNAVTEKADTRNWQTLPAQIFYVRVPMDSESNTVGFTTYRSGTVVNQGELDLKMNQDIKFLFHTTVPPESLL
ncbi:MAG: hypothetical protein RIC15_08400 [Vicingaceae bacterium]